MDPVGVALLVGAIVAYMLALQTGGQRAPWSSGLVVGLLVGFVAISLTFVVWERFQGERAVVVPRLLGRRAVGISCVCVAFFSGSYFLVIYYLPIYFQSVHNASAAMSGVYNLPLIFSVTAAMIASGIFISATGIAVPVQAAGAAVAIVSAGLLYTFDVNTSTATWIGYQILGGVGWGTAFQVPIIIGQSSASPEDMSSVTGMLLRKCRHRLIDDASR
jgi:MFS family permease